MLCFAWLLLLFSCSVVSNSLQPHGLQHARLPCPSLFPGVCSNSSLLSQWCHPTITSSVTPFSSCPQSFPASGSFSSSWLFASGGQCIGTSASASVLPKNIQVLPLIGFPHSLPSSSFIFRWRWYYRWWVGPFQELLSFPGYLPCTYYDSFVSFPQVNLSFLTEGSEPRTSKDKRKIIFPPFTWERH